MSYDLGDFSLGQGEEQAAMIAAQASAAVLPSVIGAFKGKGPKPKDCCDFCSGQKVGTTDDNTDCGRAFQCSAACRRFPLDAATIQKEMQQYGCPGCIRGGSPSGSQSITSFLGGSSVIWVVSGLFVILLLSGGGRRR